MADAEVKVAREVAEKEFERFAEAMALDIDVADMSDEDVESLKKSKRPIIRAMMAGTLIINDDGEPVFTPVMEPEASPLTFHEWVGGDLSAIGGKGSQSTQQNVILGAITKTNANRFARMKARDYKVCQAILGFFMGG